MKKIDIFTLLFFVTLIALILPAISTRSSGGPNSMAHTICSYFQQQMEIYRIEQDPKETNFQSRDIFKNQEIKDLDFKGRMLEGAKFLVRKEINYKNKDEILIVCDKAYKVYSQNPFKTNLYFYAAVSVYGEKKLLSEEDFKKIDKSKFTYTQELTK